MNEQGLKAIENYEKINEPPVYFEWTELLGIDHDFIGDFDPHDLDLSCYGYDCNRVWGNPVWCEPDGIKHSLLVKGEDAQQVKNYFWSKGIEFTFKTATETTYLHGDQDLGAVAHKIGNQWYWEQDND